MYFESLHDALHMNGHGVFVWSAYAIALGVLIGLVYIPFSRSRQFMRDQGMRVKRDESRGRNAAVSDK